MAPQDRPAHSFLWRNMDPSQPLQIFEFNRIVFGNSSSPFLAQFVVREHAKRTRNELPAAADTVLNSTYMDDCLDSTETVAEAIKLYQELKQFWERAGMYARKWLSNSRELLSQVPPEDRVAEVTLEGTPLPSTKTLGVVWRSDGDEFTFKSSQAPRVATTKRELLKTLAAVFDPLGLIAPVTVRAKILLQDLWCCGQGWDEKPEPELQTKIEAWCEELSDLGRIRVQRSLQSLPEMTSEVHIFVDASEKAYGAVSYCKSVGNGATSVQLIAAKSRVAPIATVSIPRLELMAAVLGHQLATKIASVLQKDIGSFTFWSDSMNVLYWVRGRGRFFKPFVANRIGEIQSTTNPDQWRYVPTDVNPADVLSRGASVKQLVEAESWWHGPKFLLLEANEWPEKVLEKPKQLEERRSSGLNTFVAMADKEQSLPSVPRLDPTRFSSWKKLTRVQGWVARFANNCRLPREGRRFGELLPTEIEDAEHKLIKTVQQQAFAEDIRVLKKCKQLPAHSQLRALQPKMDAENLLRSDSRLRFAEVLPFSARCPIILPRHHPVTTLIVKFYHEQVLHAGTNQTLAALSSRFWILGAREAIREWESCCFECKRRKCKPASQVMAPLPQSRVKEPLRAFARVSVDFGGPFLTKQGRGTRRQKRYLALFTRMTSRAVHLEMAYSLDTSSFLNALSRMISRRGRVLEIYSDNGTNFVGAERELRELIEGLDQAELQRSTAHEKMKWHFNPPAAPHFGGVHESMIKAAKRAIQAILKNAEATDEELVTAFSAAESLLNSRPLTYQTANPSDNIALTPGHFLYGHVGGQLAPEVDAEVAISPTKRWRHVQSLVTAFWHRWIREWLPALGTRSKWRREQPDLQPGDVVLHVCADSPRGHWPLARVLEVYPGQDGHVRVVKIQLADKTFVRPVTRLCPLVTKVDGLLDC